MEKLLGICSRDLYKWYLCCRKENVNFVLQSQAGENVEWGVSVGVTTNINSTVFLFIKIKIQITLVCGIRARVPEWNIPGVLRTGNAKAERGSDLCKRGGGGINWLHKLPHSGGR